MRYDGSSNHIIACTQLHLYINYIFKLSTRKQCVDITIRYTDGGGGASAYWPFLISGSVYFVIASFLVRNADRSNDTTKPIFFSKLFCFSNQKKV